MRPAAFTLAAWAAFPLFAAAAAPAVEPSSIAPFSAGAPGGPPPPPWHELALPRVPPPRFALVDDGGATVLRVRSRAAAGTLAQALRVELERRPILSWRWKVDRVVEKADLGTKDGDDFAARVYVFFDVPPAELPLGERIGLALARLLYGQSLPAAAICYVWDNRRRVGTSLWSPYTDRVRMVVLETGPAHAGQWLEERRDLAADYRAAFGAAAPLHDVSGIAAGNDTDQTGGTATAWFGDFHITAAGSAN